MQCTINQIKKVDNLVCDFEKFIVPSTNHLAITNSDDDSDDNDFDNYDNDSISENSKEEFQ